MSTLTKNLSIYASCAYIIWCTAQPASLADFQTSLAQRIIVVSNLHERRGLEAASMAEDKPTITRQFLALLACVSCIAIGLQPFLHSTSGLSYKIFQPWELSASGSLALILAGCAGLSALCDWRRSRKLFGILAFLYGASSLFMRISLYSTESVVEPVSWLWLPVIPAALVMLMGCCCCRESGVLNRLFWKVTGWAAILFGVAAFIGRSGVSDHSLIQALVSQATAIAAVSSIALGCVFLQLSRSDHRAIPAISDGNLRMALLGMALTMTLVYLAMVDGYRERQLLAEHLLAGLGQSLQRSTIRESENLQSMVQRWATLQRDVSESFYRSDARALMQYRTAWRGFAFLQAPDGNTWKYAESADTLSRLEALLTAPEVVRWMEDFRTGESDHAWYVPDSDDGARVLVGARPAQGRAPILIGILNLNRLIDRAVSQFPEGIRVSVLLEAQGVAELGAAPASDTSQAYPLAEAAVQLPQPAGQLDLQAVANDRFYRLGAYRYLPLGILCFGLALTFQLMTSRTWMARSVEHARRLAISEQRFRSLFDQNPSAVLCFDAQGQCLLANPASRAAFGEEAVNAQPLSLQRLFSVPSLSQSHADRVHGAVEQANKLEVASSAVFAFHSESHGLRYFDAVFLPVALGTQVDGLLCVANEITERRRGEKRQRLMERSLEASSSAFIITDSRDKRYPVIYVNEAFASITGYSRADVANVPLEAFVGGEIDPQDADKIRSALASQTASNLTVRGRRKDGSEYWCQISISPFTDVENESEHFIVVIADVTDKMATYEKLAYQATHDALTGLGNRSFLGERLREHFETSRCSGHDIAVMFIDLDDFKPINDGLGHDVGDQLLVSVAERLSVIARDHDTLVRFGGDEFALVISDVTGRQEVEDAAQRILETIARPHIFDLHDLYISVSIGIALSNDGIDRPEVLLQQADMAMQKAKKQGKDTYEVYSSDLEQALLKRVSLRNDLQEAINWCQLRVNYQPLVDAECRPCGLEALVRWQHAQKGAISPADFIPLAEETGQIIPIGRWVTRTACLDAKTLLNKGLLSGRMAVNLSPIQFHRPNFIATLKRIIDETQLSPLHLELELTEGILMSDSLGATSIIDALSELGISAAIDDFGTGYSSFGYLRELPVAKIKIDKSFVDGVLYNEKDASICRGMIRLAKELGMKVVAEGIETREQYEYLRSYGCDIFQGYYFARPMPIEALTLWLERNS